MTRTPHAARRSSTFASWSLAALALGLTPAAGQARGPGIRECSPGGPPSALASVAQVDHVTSLQRDDHGWLVASAKSQRPRLLSAGGEAIELAQPPASAETTDFIARGRAVFAVGTAKSQANGKTNVVLLRWGVDNRPRVTALSTVEALTSAPAAVLSGERLMVVWGERGRDGQSHLMRSVIDLEELRVEAPVEIGTSNGGLHLVTSDAGFTVVWSSAAGWQRASFDGKGKPSGSPSTVTGIAASALRAVDRCGERTFFLHDEGDHVAVSALDGEGSARELVRLEPPPAGEAMATRCVGETLAIGHRVVSKKGDNVVFWISTVDAKGKLRQRKVKDLSGPPENIHSLALTSEQDGLRAWWAEGNAPSLRLWAREVVCK